MPEMSCLFGVSTAPLLQALAADPVCSARLHELRECEGLELGGQRLLTVFLSGAVDPPWASEETAGDQLVDSEDPWARPHAGLLAPPLVERGWLRDALPPPDVMTRWAAIGRTHRLAWWWWWERGDDLYADAAWLFGPEGQSLALRDTHLWNGVKPENGGLYRERGAVEPLPQAPLKLAMAHLGLRSTMEHFAPTDSWRFDWAPYRVSS